MLKIKDLDMLKNIDIIYDHEVILYGAGDYGNRAVRLLNKLGISIVGFADSDEKKWGKKVNGDRVFSIQELMQTLEDRDVILIITMADPDKVEQVLCTLEGYGISEISCYTYFALKHTIELNIMDDRIPRAYRKEVSILKKIYKEAIFTSVELDGLSLICDALLYGKKILLLQPAKVGSLSVRAGLEKVGIDLDYTHTLTDDFWGDRLLKERNEGIKLLSNVKNKIKIISMVRDPIGRDISLYFHLFWEYALMDHIQADINKGINEYLESNSKIGEFGWLFEWFDTQIRDVFGVDVFEYDFDREKGYQIIEKNNVEILLMKTEKLDDCQEIIGEFIGNRDFKLRKENIGDDKLYRFAYNEAKNTIEIPDHIIDFYYKDNKRVNHFYTVKEKKEFIRKWSKGENQCIKNS